MIYAVKTTKYTQKLAVFYMTKSIL